MNGIESKNIRNIAIIAHVDHGKTTLVDYLLRQTGAFRSNQAVSDCIMDSNDIERERGITILAKNTSVFYKDVKINIIDTPGHHDFGGQVERVLRMAEGALLLVDAADGPMPQTRFVLRKALANKLHPIVVINKLDRQDARPKEVLDEVFYLFMELDATDEQMNFPVVYTIGREGKAKLKLEDEWSNLVPLLDTILARVPPTEGNPLSSLQVGVCAIDYNDYVGRMAIGKVSQGLAEKDTAVTLIKRDGRRIAGSIVELSTFMNLKREQVNSAVTGDIVCISGITEVDIGDTIAGGDNPTPLDFAKVDEPTLAMNFLVNNSPLSGRDGKFITSRHLRDRLFRETLSDPALHVEETASMDTFRVSGRGLLHLSILIENMRREGYELQVSRPEMITKTINGVLCEPVELASLDVPDEYAGRVIELMSSRRGVVEKINSRRERTHMLIRIPARGLVGLQSKLLSITRGQAVMYSGFEGYEEYRGPIPDRIAGVIVSQCAGEAATYALDNLQSRGLFGKRDGQSFWHSQEDLLQVV